MASEEAAARKLLSSVGGGFSFFGASKTDKLENASDKFVSAANAYRAERDMKKSGEMFEQAAKIQLNQLNEPVEGARMLQDAYKSYREVSPADGERCLSEAIKLYTSKGNFRRAADLICDLAEVQERQNKLPQALDSLEKAIQWYTDENIPATANKARQRAGQLAAESGNFYKALEIFVAAAKAALQTGPTGRFSVKTYLLKAGICQLATGDTIGSRKQIESWNELDRGFDQEREGRFLHDLLAAQENHDAEKFGYLCQQWDSMSKMEDWQITVLLKARSEAQGEEGNDDDFS